MQSDHNGYEEIECGRHCKTRPFEETSECGEEEIGPFLGKLEERLMKESFKIWNRRRWKDYQLPIHIIGLQNIYLYIFLLHINW